SGRAPQRPQAAKQPESERAREHKLEQLTQKPPGPSRVRRPQRGLADKLDRVLGSQSGLQGAILLSEILSPPVSLRDDHLTR
ncbi:MAG: hypothetical protein KKB50_21175, partial [Planctomycetes bacterium]|nr:hypothetical protein [Planctomycetota bacterium]